LAKKELFKPPFGWYFRWVGGTPLDRTPNQNKVDAIAEIFQKKEILRLSMSPEGTRKKTERWKTGFYYIAKAANVPIIRVAFDYGKKRVTFSEPFYPTENVEKDLEEILRFYDGVQGKVVGNF
jgi:1-acyl-sn-glycerol-3-phosphate acyltransferase